MGEGEGGRRRGGGRRKGKGAVGVLVEEETFLEADGEGRN
jgi:hypothetical protein